MSVLSLFCVCCRSGQCHGVVLWMEYHLTEDITVSGGLTGPISEQVLYSASLHGEF